MKLMLTALMGFCLFILLAPPVNADDNTAQNVAIICNVELSSFCKDVTTGKGRILACLYAYSDKLSDQCQHAVLDAAEQVKLMGAAFSFLKSECEEDLDSFCKDVAPGDGRLMNCLEKNDDKLSKKCKLALKDVGLKQ